VIVPPTSTLTQVPDEILPVVAIVGPKVGAFL
jgi:hypothetical protein